MTAKKKTLIELMLDAGVKPEDIDYECNFLVCDSRGGDPVVSLYRKKPIHIGAFWTSGCGFICYLRDGLILPYFIENWKLKIITKQHFVDAYNEKHAIGEKTNIAEDKQVEDVEPCMVVDNSAYDCTTTDDSGISLSFEEADKRADNYASLSNVLRRAYDQASSGKGQERHGQDLQFTKQPMQLIQDLCGEGFALGQAMKKMQESQRLPHDAAIRELLGAINYIAGAIIHKEKLQGSK